ncbi:MAG: polysaccharide deacetylase family protein [Magnetococcales bacterium]|nr:polysaccharide deacetylase family protein [Magnetococcales bacterium]
MKVCCRTLLFCCLALVGCLLPLRGHGEVNTVYLTFDDGPRISTQDILDLLSREKVPGTFFLIGAHIQISPTRMKIFRNLQASPWAQVANHSFSHAKEQYQAFYNDPEGMLQDFKQNSTLLGFLSPPFLARLPGRIDWRFEHYYTNDQTYPANRIDRVPAGVAKLFEHQFILYGWDIEWKKDRKTRQMENPDHLADRIIKRFANHDSVKPNKVVLLMHDQNFNGKEGMALIQTLIHRLRQAGYCFGFMRSYAESSHPADWLD